MKGYTKVSAVKMVNNQNIFSMMRVGINPFIIFAVTVSSVVVFTVVIARISKKNVSLWIWKSTLLK